MLMLKKEVAPKDTSYKAVAQEVLGEQPRWWRLLFSVKT